MQRPRRLRPWIGATATVAFAALWMVSAVWTVLRVDPRPGRGVGSAGIGAGCLIVVLIVDPGFNRSAQAPRVAWMAWRREGAIRWIPRFDRWPAPRSVYGAEVPLWIPLVLIGGPAGWSWWRECRRARRGCCAPCGYDLAGVPPDAPCPECGSARQRGRGARDRRVSLVDAPHG